MLDQHLRLNAVAAGLLQGAGAVGPGAEGAARLELLQPLPALLQLAGQLLGALLLFALQDGALALHLFQLGSRFLGSFLLLGNLNCRTNMIC